MFVYYELAGNNSTRRIQTWVLIFINKSPVHWYSKRQATFEASTLGADLFAMKAGVEMVEDLRYNLLMFVVPIDGFANVFCDNEDV